MCDCKNIKVQTKECYAQQIEMDIPANMSEYRDRIILAGRKPTICIDPCILEEIQDLWELGVITYSCCCGHNYLPPMVNVDHKNIQQMLDMGYEQEHDDPARKGTFRLTSVPYPVSRNFLPKLWRKFKRNMIKI